MTQLITPQFLDYCQSNLHIGVGLNKQNFKEFKNKLKSLDEYDKYNQHYFQILLFENINEPGKLVYGTKEELEKKYHLDHQSFPTYGVDIDEGFFEGVPEESKSAVFATVRFLLQSRKLSQMITYTWLEQDKIPESMEVQIKLIRKIFDSYNLIPKVYSVENDQKPKNQIKLEKHLLRIKDEGKNDKLNFLIQPSSLGYQSITLALLLCGQAYYKNKDNQWVLISPSIFSTYEMIWEYALEVSWDTFYASKVDLSQATGGLPRPPFAKLILGYPPKPNQYSLGQDQIYRWSNAQEEHCSGNEFPFYPERNSEKWQNQQLEYIMPPYPYIPTSTC